MKRGEIIFCAMVPLHFTMILTSEAVSPHSCFSLCVSLGYRFLCSTNTVDDSCYTALFCIICNWEEKGQRSAERGCTKQCFALKQCSVNYILAVRLLHIMQTNTTNTAEYIMQVFPVQMWWITSSSSPLFSWVSFNSGLPPYPHRTNCSRAWLQSK